MNKYKLLIIICFFLVTLCLPRVTATVKNLNLLGKVIILDAGHGGKDEGASSGPIKESKLNLILTKKLEKEFNDFFHEVILETFKNAKYKNNYKLKYETLISSTS